MKNICLAIFLIFTFVQTAYGADTANEGLFLVVGSARKEGALSYWHKQLTGINSDGSHLNTFNKRATTVDILDSFVRNARHLKIDARMLNPGAESIRAVFMELFPSIDVPYGPSEESNDPETEAKRMSLMPDAIVNLARYMSTGTVLDIEHFPHFSIAISGDNTDPRLVTAIEENPFRCFVSLDFIRGIQSDISSATRVAWQEVSSLLGMSEESFAAQVAHELSFFNQNESQFIAKNFGQSLISVIAAERCMQTQQHLVKRFLESANFENITARHQTNPHNGRKKVWMISATKK